MDPILLSLVGFVILVYFSFVILLALWIKSVTREKNECREVVAILKRKLLEEKGSPQESDILATSVANFTLAYYDRVRARNTSVEPANEAMELTWKCLPKYFQEKLAPLGSLANLKAFDNPSR